jgi:hypothetical protein
MLIVHDESYQQVLQLKDEYLMQDEQMRFTNLLLNCWSEEDH